MKKNLRLLCLGLAAATFTAGFAQAQDVTSKLRNADMEQGVWGWGIDGESNIFGKQTKNGGGYHGMSNGVLETWNGSGSPLGDNSILQKVRELPAGTYVFGAYIGASLQGTEESNKDAVTGVTLFANEAGVAVATDNPDKGRQVKWAHTAKFNVAATVAEGGSLNVGIDIKNTTANYVVWDNATLYYFGNMSEDEALNEMAKIDMAATVAIADTCVDYKMNADTLALLQEGITAAKALTTADQLWQLNEDLYWAIRLAHNSMSDYKSFVNILKAAQAVVARDGWTGAAQPDIAALNTAIAEAEAIYEEAKLNRVELNEKKAALREATARVELDSMMTIYEDVYLPFVEDLPVSDEEGDYSEAQKDTLEALGNDVNDAYNAVFEGTMTAVEALAYIQKMWDLMEEVESNPNTGGFKVTITTSQEPNADGRYTYTSQVYSLVNPLAKLRFTFQDTFCPNGAGKGDPVFVALGEFYLYDEYGDPVMLSEEDFYTNAQEPSEGPMKNICDGDINTFWHSNWHGSVSEEHYLEVTIPDGIELTSFSFGWICRGNRQNIPLVVEVEAASSIGSTAPADLASAISSAKVVLPYTGTEPGYYKEDVSSFYKALAAAEALVGTEASDDEIYAAIGALEEEQGKIDEMSMIMPDPSKKYRIVSADHRFFGNQNIVKTLTVRNDTLWWETASPDSLQQEFTLEVMPNNDGACYYKLRNVKTGLYVNSGTEGDYHPLLAAADTVELIPLGAGQFGLRSYYRPNHPDEGKRGGAIHACDHNSGVIGEGWNGEIYGPAGGMFGDYSRVIPYGEADLNGGSAWFIREMVTLPYATKSCSDLNFQSEPIHLYEGVNTLTLTADKVSAFADLILYDIWGEVISSTVSVSGNTATVMLDTTAVESFSFVFANSEGVASVNIDGSLTGAELIPLQDALDAALAVAPERGTEVMQFANLDAYDAAIAAAEKILLSGGTEEEILAAIAALEKAVAELAPNMPDPDKAYFIVSALDAFEENHGVKMMLYSTNDGTPRWMYENTVNPNRLWKFELDTEVEEGAPAMFYLKNVGTEMYFGDGTAALVADKDGAISYAITQLQGTVVALDGSASSSKRIHANGHGGGFGKGGNVVYWSSGFGTASSWRICESEAYISDIDFAEIEEGADEYVAPVVKGIYDLFGRRIETPAAAGIYIVDGKKVLIKREQK